MRHQQKRPELRERAEIFSLQLSPRLNKRSRCVHPALRADQAKPPQRKLDVLHQTPPGVAKKWGLKEAFMLSGHNEASKRSRRVSDCLTRRRERRRHSGLSWAQHLYRFAKSNA